MKSDIYLIGGGGHCISAIDVIESTNIYNIRGIFDLPENIGKNIMGYNIIDVDSNIINYISPKVFFIVTLGQIKTAEPRKLIFEKLLSLGANVATIISPLAHVSKHASLGAGTLVLHHALINAGVTIGENCIINSKALIEHSAHIGSNTHISTGAIVNGDCVIEECSFIGSNSVLEQGLYAPAKSILAAGKFHRLRE